MAESERNIAHVARAGSDFYSWLGGMSPITDNVGKIQQIYGDEDWGFKTSKGRWSIHEDSGFVPPSFLDSETPSIDRFCALYWRGDKAYSMFSGTGTQREVVDEVARTLTAKVFEEKPFASPPRGLREGNDEYTFFRNLFGTSVLGLCILADMKLTDMALHDPGFDYLGGVFGQLYKMGATGALATFGVLAGVLGYTAFQGFIGRGKGRETDQKRMQGLPEESRNFLFGREASSAVFEEIGARKAVAKMQTQYDLLRSHDVEIDKIDFVPLFQLAQKKDRETMLQATELLERIEKQGVSRNQILEILAA